MRKLLVGVIATALVLVGGWFAAACVAPALTAGASGSSAHTASAPTCPAAPPVTIGTIVVPAGPVAGFCQSELVMAAHIMNAARDQGIGTHTQAVGVMTAIGESGLRNLDYGDAAGPDSRGLFQQRPSTGWGTPDQVLDPARATLAFYGGANNPNKGRTRGLLDIPNWSAMSVTQAAQAVQISAFPDAYAKWETSARAWLAQLG